MLIEALDLMMSFQLDIWASVSSGSELESWLPFGGLGPGPSPQASLHSSKQQAKKQTPKLIYKSRDSTFTACSTALGMHWVFNHWREVSIYWVHTEQQLGLWVGFPALAGHRTGPGPAELSVWGLKLTRVCTEQASCVRSPVLFCKWMPKTWPACSSARLNLRDRLLGKVEKKGFIVLPDKGGHSGLMPLRTMCPNQEGIGEEFCGARQKIRVQAPCWEDPLENGMTTCSSILAQRIPWTEELGGLQSTGSQSQTRLRDQHFHFG